jgi:hypothetical protein
MARKKEPVPRGDGSPAPTDATAAPSLTARLREMRIEHTRHLMRIGAEANAAWERSKHGGTRKGNPAFLAEANAALSDIRRMWGDEGIPPALVEPAEQSSPGADRPPHGAGLRSSARPSRNGGNGDD